MLHLISRCFVLSFPFVILFSSISCKSEATFNCQDCWKAEESDSSIAPFCDKPLNYYIDSVQSFADLRGADNVIWSIGDKINTKVLLNIDTVGLLNEHPVLDIIFKLGTPEQYLIGKTILVEASKNRYHLLYTLVTETDGFSPAPSQIFHVDSHEILSTKSRFAGQMSMYSIAHWTWNSEGNFPCKLKHGYSIKDVFAQEIKGEWKSSWIGSLDLDSLYAWSYVARPGDHYRWPTGGRIWEKLGIDGCEFVVLEKGFDSTDIAPH